MIKIILIYLLALISCVHPTVQPHSKDEIISALDVIVDHYAESGLYTKDKMRSVLRGDNMNKHDLCRKDKHHIKIVFTNGEWSRSYGRRCMFVPSFEGICLAGLFNGVHTIYMIEENKIHKSSFAHELLHYFQLYIDGEKRVDHEPRGMWVDYVGYNIDYAIGLTNEALRDKGY